MTDSKKIDDGGPAYPHGYSAQANSMPGMSLRDHFAGQAMMGWVASYGPEDGRPNPESCAEIAYAVADAMIAARKGGEA